MNLDRLRKAGRFGAALFAGLAVAQSAQLELKAQNPIDLRAERIAPWTVEESIRIGSHDGQWDAFHQVAGVRMGPRGTVLILDYGIPAIRVFDQEGSFLRQVGSRGEGPGELLAPSSWGIEGDRIWVADQRLGRVMEFTFDGEHVSDRRLQPNATGRRPEFTPIQRLPEGGFLAVTPSGPDLTDAAPGVAEFEQHLVRLDRELEPVETLRSHSVELGAISLGGGGLWAFDPFPDRPLTLHASPERSIVVHRRPSPERGDADEFRVSVLGENGQVLSRTFRYEPVEIPAQVRDSLRATAEGRLPPALPEELREQILGLVQLPPAKPPVSAAHLTLEGSVWLERERSEERTRWLVLDRELRPIAEVRGPRGVSMRLEAVTDENIWVVEEDEYGVQYVVRYRIQR